MFKKLHLISAVSSLLLLSCSDDDNSTPISINNPLPLSHGNYWVYDVQATTINGRDSLYVDSETVINGNTYKNFKTESLPLGLYSNVLNNSAVRQSDDNILLTAVLSPDISGLPIDIEVNDFVIFNTNAENGTQLAQTSNSFNETVQDFTIQGDYMFSSFAGETLSSYTLPNGETYSDVKSTVLKLNLNITVTMNGIPLPFTLLPAQDVITTTHYYAEGVGMIYAVTNIQYELADTFGIELPLPQSMSEYQEEILVKYSVEP